MLKILLSLLLVIALHPIAFGSNDLMLRQYEDSLKHLSEILLQSSGDDVKEEANENFTNLLFEVLDWKEAFNYPFDSIILVSKLWSPDRKFRIFTWYIPLSNGNYEYAGLIHLKGAKRYYRFLLNDESETMKDPGKAIVDNNHWYGAVYSQIILTKHRGRKYYTLLGWDGNNPFTTKKVIDVLTFKGDIKPTFGYNLFKAEGTNIKRYFFEYNKQATMILAYEEQFLTYSRKRIIPFRFFNKSNRGTVDKVSKKAEKMIVFDRLIPLHSSLEGQYEFYVPATNIIDAFIWRDGKWNLARDIDARNPAVKIPRKDRPKPPVDGLFPPE